MSDLDKPTEGQLYCQKIQSYFLNKEISIFRIYSNECWRFVYNTKQFRDEIIEQSLNYNLCVMTVIEDTVNEYILHKNGNVYHTSGTVLPLLSLLRSQIIYVEVNKNDQ